MYIARFTTQPAADIERGWSGWFGGQYKTRIEYVIENTSVDVLEAAYQRSSEEDYDAFLESYAEDHADDEVIRFDAQCGAYRVFHHDGLSCWALEAQTEADAIAEARQLASSGEIQHGSLGQRTHGRVVLVGAVEGIETLYVFWCDSTSAE